MTSKSVRVFAPATVANVAVGFDHLGFAIDAPGDEVVIRTGSEHGLVISSITGDGGKLSREVKKNTAGVAVMQLLEYVGANDVSLDLEIIKKMPCGTGMGSSAASAAAAVFAASEYVETGLSKVELLRFAVAGEQVADGAWHADNVAPSLLGGMVLIRDNATMDVVQLPVPSDIRAVVVYPHVEVLTRDSRNVLSETVDFRAATQQAANASAFVASLYSKDYALLRRSLHDCLVEDQRKHLIPKFEEVQEIANSANAVGCSISGAGPSMFVLCDLSTDIGSIERKVIELYSADGIGCDVYVSAINTNGAIIC